MFDSKRPSILMWRDGAGYRSGDAQLVEDKIVYLGKSRIDRNYDHNGEFVMIGPAQVAAAWLIAAALVTILFLAG